MNPSSKLLANAGGQNVNSPNTRLSPVKGARSSSNQRSGANVSLTHRSSFGPQLVSPRGEQLRSPSSASTLESARNKLLRNVAENPDALRPFLDVTLRCMRFRAYQRWHYGIFRSSPTKHLILSYFFAVLTGLMCFCISCSQETFGSNARFLYADSESFWHSASLSLRVTLVLGSVFICLTTILFLLFSKSARTKQVQASVFLSLFFLGGSIAYLTIGSVLAHSLFNLGSFWFQQCPPPGFGSDFPFALPVFLLIQFLVSCMGLVDRYLLSQVRSYRILRSPGFLKHWHATLIDVVEVQAFPANEETPRKSSGGSSLGSSSDSTPDNFGISVGCILRACPSGCEFKQKKTSRARHDRNDICGKTGHSSVLSYIFFKYVYEPLFPSSLFSPLDEFLPASTPEACCSKCCFYIGQVNDRFLPHGSGHWQQGWGEPHGETLVGFWEYGTPVAPFRARQNKCGSGFSALRFGWVRFRFSDPEAYNDVYNSSGFEGSGKSQDVELSAEDFEFGLLDVECSVFGRFFRKFPKFIYWNAPRNPPHPDRISLSRMSQPSVRKSAATLGLNNRMMSFAEEELSAASPLMKRLGSVIAPPAPFGEALEADQRPSTTGSMFFAHKRLTTSKSPLREISRGSDLFMDDNGIQLSNKSGNDRSKAVEIDSRIVDGTDVDLFCHASSKWIVSRLMPFHVPSYAGTSPATSGEPDEILVKVDEKMGLVPVGYKREVGVQKPLGDFAEHKYNLLTEGDPKVPKYDGEEGSHSDLEHDDGDVDLLSEPPVTLKHKLPRGESPEFCRTLSPLVVKIEQSRKGTSSSQQATVMTLVAAPRYSDRLTIRLGQSMQPKLGSQMSMFQRQMTRATAANTATAGRTTRLLRRLSVADAGCAPSPSVGQQLLARGCTSAWNAPTRSPSILGNATGGSPPIDLILDGWIRNDNNDPYGLVSGPTEALVFIHGYKTPPQEAPLLLGQLVALGNFPNRIKPFMFLWPAGLEVWHFNQARRASNHKLAQKALLSFIKSLADMGFTDLHLMAHSMGSRLFFNAVHNFGSDLFHKCTKGSGSTPHFSRANDGKVRLNFVNLIIINGEQYLHDFIERDYDNVRQFVQRITVFCDRDDQALESAELLSKGIRSMGKHPFSYLKPKNFVASNKTVRRDVSNTITAASTTEVADQNDWENNNSGCPNSVNMYKQMVADTRDNGDQTDEWEWLDLDVIDTTFLDNNVHGLRHCFFNINREVVNDLRDIVTLRLPAAQRRNFLERREGNVFTYRAAPGELRSIFGF